jgi:hypothetical protein
MTSLAPIDASFYITFQGLSFADTVSGSSCHTVPGRICHTVPGGGSSQIVGITIVHEPRKRFVVLAETLLLPLLLHDGSSVHDEDQFCHGYVIAVSIQSLVNVAVPKRSSSLFQYPLLAELLVPIECLLIL